jgi:hypothetical protein
VRYGASTAFEHDLVAGWLLDPSRGAPEPDAAFEIMERLPARVLFESLLASRGRRDMTATGPHPGRCCPGSLSRMIVLGEGAIRRVPQAVVRERTRRRLELIAGGVGLFLAFGLGAGVVCRRRRARASA